MMPPITRQCPECGTRDWSRRFTVVVTDTGRRLVACPSCNHQFKPVDNPFLN